MDLTPTLKQELWKRFGTKEHPAEWDGLVYGGGKLSQRYWEYFQAIELLALDDQSVILDIGGGSPTTGMGFFSSLLATSAQKVFVMDPNIKEDAPQPENVVFIRMPATHASLGNLLKAHPEITHISCISVFEHIEPSVREGMTLAIDEHFQGRSFVSTVEYHPKRTHFEQALTARTLSALFAPMTRFFPDHLSASPVLSENAYDTARLLRLSKDPITGKYNSRGDIPRWYPLAVRFVRGMQS